MPANIAPVTSPAANSGSTSSRPIQPLHQASGNPAAASSPPPSTGGSLTQKQWTVPPRPKPGRKPATDTPATKRKAQNRVAQRAFRERKAAKIGELEEQIDDIGKEHAAEVAALRMQMASLMAQLDQQNAGSTPRSAESVSDSRADVERWQIAYAEEKRLRENLEREMAILKGEAVSLPRRHQDQSYHTPEDMALGCTKCSLTHCQCFEDALEGKFAGYHPNGPHKRDTSPATLAPTGDKKHQSSMEVDIAAEELRPGVPDEPASVLDGCGFCTEGSACLCADLAADMAAKRQMAVQDSANLPSPPSEATAMEIDFTTAPKTGSGCPDGPGSCTACQRDPERALFCKTLAASRETGPAGLVTAVSSQPARPSRAAPAPCAAGAACCRLSTTLSSSTHHAAVALPRGLTISCAEAFNTLQRHPAFGQASQDIGEWLPRLTTVTAGIETDQHANPQGAKSLTSSVNPFAATQGPNHTAFEIETASILGVLRFFDRRFGREA